MARVSSDSFDWPELSSPVAGVADGQRDAALIVAIEDYAFLPPVAGAIENGRDWFMYLTRSRRLPLERVRFLSNADATDFAILQALKDVSSQAEAGGRVWFIFIGHGAASSATQDGLLVAADAQQTAQGIENRSVPRSKALGLLSKSAATPIALIDACFSGRRPDGEPLVQGLQPTSVVKTPVPTAAVVMMASASNEYAGPLPGSVRPAFSYLALGALRGWGDSNEDGTVTAQETVDYSRSVLATLLSGRRVQTPEADGQRSFPLASAREPGPDVGEILLQMKGGSRSRLKRLFASPAPDRARTASLGAASIEPGAADDVAAPIVSTPSRRSVPSADEATREEEPESPEFARSGHALFRVRGAVLINPFEAEEDAYFDGGSGQAEVAAEVDYFVTDGLALGGAAFYGVANVSDSEMNLVGAAPRVSYAIPLFSWLSIMPTADAAVVHFIDQKHSLNVFGWLSAPLLFTIPQDGYRFSLGLGPRVSLPLVDALGSCKPAFGFSLSLGAYF